MNADDPRHGTVAGYSAHHRNRQKPCRPCLHAKNVANKARLAGEAESEQIALTGGRWVLGPRRVLVWQPSKSGGACPVCNCAVTETCRGRDGQPRRDHDTRTIPRQCPCGETVARGRTLCKDCRAQAARDSQAEYRRRSLCA